MVDFIRSKSSGKINKLRTIEHNYNLYGGFDVEFFASKSGFSVSLIKEYLSRLRAQGRVPYLSDSCKNCGELFNKSRETQVHCSAKCRQRNKLPRIRADRVKSYGLKQCEGCGVSGKKTIKGLCADCRKVSRGVNRQIYNRTRRGSSHLPPLLGLNGPKVRPLSECNVCGIMYKPKRYDRTTCCSKKCGHVWTGFKYSAKANGGRVYVRTVRNKPAPLVFVDHPPAPKICYACGDGFYPARKFQRECSDQCKEEHRKKIKAEYRNSDAHKKLRRSAKSKRRAITRGATVGEAIDPYDVFKRDKWTCQMCGCQTPKRERGSINDNAPELDHIYPISKGGEHSMRNLQCLCRSCNQKKSDDVIEGMGYAVQAGVGHSCNT